MNRKRILPDMQWIGQTILDFKRTETESMYIIVYLATICKKFRESTCRIYALKQGNYEIYALLINFTVKIGYSISI